MAPTLLPEIEPWMADAVKAAFLLDFDGTMVYLGDRPDQVHVPKTLIENLKKISLNPHLSFAIVTGRALHALDALMEGLTTVAVGSHGAEWRASPTVGIEIIAPLVPLSIRQSLAILAAHHQCIFEDKLYTLSLHLPFEDIDKDLTAEILAALGDAKQDYTVRRIGRTFEVLQATINKGTGITHIMQQPKFAGKRPLYIGDDVGTDTSLDVIDSLGGMRLGVSNHALNEPHLNKEFIGIDSVNWIVQLLADYTVLS